MIKLENVNKEYQLGNGSFFALKNINLEIETGESVAIIGPSGSGKSTLMHIIGLLDTPTSGTVYLENKDVSKLSDDKLSHLRNRFIGFIFQQFNLVNKLTVLENILLPTIYCRDGLSFDPLEKAYQLMKRFGIDDKAKSYPNKISGGQQQRVAIARALMNKPRLILADEPTGNLDSKTGKTILSLLEQLNREDKITLVIVTHERQVSKIARRTIPLKDGQIVKRLYGIF